MKSQKVTPIAPRNRRFFCVNFFLLNMSATRKAAHKISQSQTRCFRHGKLPFQPTAPRNRRLIFLIFLKDNATVNAHSKTMLHVIVTTVYARLPKHQKAHLKHILATCRQCFEDCTFCYGKAPFTAQIFP